MKNPFALKQHWDDHELIYYGPDHRFVSIELGDVGYYWQHREEDRPEAGPFATPFDAYCWVSKFRD